MTLPRATSERTFDPAAEIQKLRDHLGSHDKPIAFLFGAGTSASVMATDDEPLIPAVAALTNRCAASVKSLGDPYDQAWDSIVDSLPADRRTIEDILSAVRQMLAAILPNDTLAGLDPAQLTALEKNVQETISAEVRPAASRWPATLPHEALARWIRRLDRVKPVEIFTTNYDTLLERALEKEWVPVFDGFVGSFEPFFSPASLVLDPMAPGRRWTRLWKIHGSVTWASKGARGRIVRGEERTSGELILPSLLKYDESRKQPYLAMLDRLRRVLADREDTILVASGYSFGDQHINEVVFEALEANPRLHVFALCFEQPGPSSELAVAAQRYGNILVLGPDGATVGSRDGMWALQDPAGSAARLDGLFDVTSGGGATPGGKLRLGDFNVLCLLLDRVAGSDV